MRVTQYLLCFFWIALLSACSSAASNLYTPDSFEPLTVSVGEVQTAVPELRSGTPVRAATVRLEDPEDALPRISASAFKSYPAHDGKINSIASGRSGELVFTAGEDGLVLEHRATKDADGQLAVLSRPVYRSANPILSLSLSPDGRLLAVAQLGLVFVVDLKRTAIIHRLTKLGGSVVSMAWDPSGDLLALGRSNGVVVIWNIKQGDAPAADNDRALEQYIGHPSPVTNIVFHPRGRVFFAAHRDSVILMWRLVRTEFEMGLRDDAFAKDLDRRGKKNLVITGFAGRVQDMSLRGDGAYLMVALSTGKVIRVKIRGTLIRDVLDRGREHATSLRSINLDPIQENGGTSSRNISVAAFRSRELVFWCPTTEEDPVFAVSQPFDDTVEQLAVGARGPYLWGAQKSGNLLGFNAKFLLSSPPISTELQRCPRLVLDEAG